MEAVIHACRESQRGIAAVAVVMCQTVVAQQVGERVGQPFAWNTSVPKTAPQAPTIASQG